VSRVVSLSVVLFVFMARGLFGISPAFGQIEDALSPAQGHASVIAQGVSVMDNGDLGWRVTRASSPQVNTELSQDAPGFLLADQGALLVEQIDASSQSRLAPGEATFLPSGARHEEAALGEAPVSFYRIDLVAAGEVNDAGADELLFVGQPFASPGGSRDIDLVRDVIASGEQIELALEEQAAPVLLLVTTGTVELVPAGNDAATPVALATGQGAALSGDVVVSAADGVGATFVTAIVGSDVTAPIAPVVTPTATPLPEPASLLVQAYACPVAYEGTEYGIDCAEPLAEIVFDLAAATAGTSFQGTTGGDGTVTFADLIPDTYSLSGGVPGEFAAQVVACANAAGPLPTEASQTLAPGAVLTLAAGETASCLWYVIPEDLRGENQGTVAVTLYLCPGTPADPFADCSLGDATGVVIGGPVSLTTDAASEVSARVTDAALIWGEEGGVPFGDYVLQPGGIFVPEGYELSEIRGSSAGSGSGGAFSIDEANPDASLALIYVPASQQPADPNVDTDRDGLTDGQEAEIGSDPANPDTDEDGLFDGPELAVGTDPTLFDSDGDGSGDNQEATGGADPNDPASVPEGDSGLDTDGDLLTDAQEDVIGTNAATPDSDGDGLTDFAEVGFEPGSATGTHPLVFDTDGDGIGDGDEVTNGTDPTDPADA